MKIGFVIPARLKSTRLEKKILLKLGDQMALEWAIDRARLSKSIDEVVVATTGLSSDVEISKICIDKGIRYFQGDPEDVLLRLRDSAIYFEFDYIINITPDNTLFSTYLIDLMVSTIKKDRTLDFIKYKDPILGTGVYGLKREALETICDFKNVLNTEIWGPLFNEKYFKVKELEVPGFLKADYRLTMDTDLDYIMISKIYSGLDITSKRIPELNEIINFLDNNPQIAKINKDIVQNSVSEEYIKSINSNFNNNERLFWEIKDKYYGTGSCHV